MRRMPGLVVVAMVCLFTSACAASPPAPADPSGDVPRPSASPSSAATAPHRASVEAAVAELAALRVDRGGASAPYARAAFGEAWTDVDGNGCDTRNDVLARDLADPELRPATGECKVARDTLVDPYDGARVPFTSGVVTSERVQIDHVVSLSYAWRHGAEGWTSERRLPFANDPRDLLAVSEPMNDAKGPFGPGQWLPPSTTGRCVFVVRWVAVMSAYRLTVHPGDRAAAESVLRAC